MAFGFGFGMPRIFTAPFTPAALFLGGQQGAWYDPSDLTTLFQDSAGTTPVTAVQQPVGLMLDKSKGLVLGPELVTATYAGTASGGFSITSTSIVRDGVTSGGEAGLTLAASVTSGRRYQVIFTAAGLSGDNTIIRVGSVSTGDFYRITTAGTYTLRFPAAASAAVIGIAPFAGTAGGITITNISVKELPGNHAFQTTSASRPVLSARYNQFTETEFRNGVTDAPTRGGLVTATTLTGYLGALAFGHDGSTTTFAYKNNITVNSGVLHTVSVVVEMTDGLVPTFNNADPINSNNAFAIVIGGTAISPTTYIVIPLGGTQYRVSCTGTGLVTSANNGIVKYGTNSARTFKVTAYDIRLANDALGQPAYQRVNTSTDYDTVGFKPYLAFDGVDDSLVTNSIDFTATDKMTVFAGVRKLSDATLGMLLELSATDLGNNGMFSLLVPQDNAIPANQWRSKGTARADATTANTFAAPITSVLTGIGNISGDVATLRINGTQAATSTADQGTGNFGNYPLFIGRRANINLPFNGRIYSLIVRGAASTTAQITSTETYVNQKTGAYT